MASAQLTADSDDSLPGQSGGEPADDGFDDLRGMLGVARISDRLRTHLNTVADGFGNGPDAPEVPPAQCPSRPHEAGLRQAGTPLWVSIEGINGVGKTSAARATAAALGARGVLLNELTDQANDTLPGKVIAALSGNNDLFLRTGHPVVETLALLALQVRKTERLAWRDLTGAAVIIEDRGMDSVAVYQAAILCAEHPQQPAQDLARRILADAQRWCGLPDATVLLTADPAVCAQRFADRLGRQLTRADGLLIEQIDRLYRAMAADDPERYIILDVADLSPQETAEALGRTVNALLDRRDTLTMRGTAA